MDWAILLTLAANLVATTYFFSRLQFRLEDIGRRLTALEAGLAQLEIRIAVLEQRVTDLIARVERLEEKVDTVIRRIDQSSYVPSEAAAGKR